MKSHWGRTLFRASVLFALGPFVAAQTTWFVDVNAVPPGNGTHSNPYASIQYAIDRPSTLAGDTVFVGPGTYVENVIFHGKSIVLRSVAGPSVTVIDGNNADSCVQMVNGETAATVLDGFTLTRGAAPMFSGGGGLRLYTASPVVKNCIIRGNTAVTQGGGIWAGFMSASIRNCVVSGNTVTNGTDGGGGLYAMYGFNLSITNCTFRENSAPQGASMKIDHGGNVIVRNTILWSTPGNATASYQASPVFSWCDVEGGLGGVGIFDGDPLFWNVIANDFHLKPGSPCIDAGDPNDPLDADGSRADVGAYTFDPAYCGAPFIYCTAKVNSQGCVPAIAYTGLPSSSSVNPFLITAVRVINNSNGLLIYGFASSAVPFQGGALCVASPITRTLIQNSGGNPTPTDCSGSFSYNFNARIQSGLDPGLVPARTVYCQYYYRDSPASFGVGLTDAIAFTICP